MENLNKLYLSFKSSNSIFNKLNKHHLTTFLHYNIFFYNNNSIYHYKKKVINPTHFNISNNNYFDYYSPLFLNEINYFDIVMLLTVSEYSRLIDINVYHYLRNYLYYFHKDTSLQNPYVNTTLMFGHKINLSPKATYKIHNYIKHFNISYNQINKSKKSKYFKLFKGVSNLMGELSLINMNFPYIFKDYNLEIMYKHMSDNIIFPYVPDSNYFRKGFFYRYGKVNIYNKFSFFLYNHYNSFFFKLGSVVSYLTYKLNSLMLFYFLLNFFNKAEYFFFNSF